MSDTLSFSTPERIGIIQRISVRFGGSKSRELERFLKFAVVGTIGAVIDLGLTNILLRFVFHVQPGDVVPAVISSALGFTAAVISNFIWNRYWTYPDSRSRPVVAQLGQFFVVNLIGLGIRALVVALLATPFTTLVGDVVASIRPDVQAQLGDNMAIMVALVIVMMWNFFVNRYWTYSDVE